MFYFGLIFNCSQAVAAAVARGASAAQIEALKLVEFKKGMYPTEDCTYVLQFVV
jgi:uncharacterized protein YqfB (UPF0267 family)